MFNTFAEKMEQVEVKNVVTRSETINIRHVLADMTTQEGFDQSDLMGLKYTQNKPLIVVRSAMTDDYYLNTIKPLLYYSDKPFGGFVTYFREQGQSILPDWAIIVDPLYDNNPMEYFPWRHAVSAVYYQDFRAAQNQIAANPTARATYGHIITAGFPLLPRTGSYDLLFSYTLPNGVVTDSSVVKTFVLP